MRTRPEHDRAMLHTDTAALRECAERLDALTRDALPAQCGPDWTGVLTALAERCRVAAAELERAAAAFSAEAADSAEASEAADSAPGARTRAVAGRLLAAPRAAAEPFKPVLRRLSER